MGTLTIRNLDDTVIRALRQRAAAHDQSMEAEVRAILRASVASTDAARPPLGEALHRRFGPENGVELTAPRRDRQRPPPTFD